MQNSEVLISRTLGNKEGAVWKKAGVDMTGERALAWLETEEDDAFTKVTIEVDLATGVIKHAFLREPLGCEDVEGMLEEKLSALKLLDEVEKLITSDENPDKQKREGVISLIRENIEVYYASSKFSVSHS